MNINGRCAYNGIYMLPIGIDEAKCRSLADKFESYHEFFRNSHTPCVCYETFYVLENEEHVQIKEWYYRIIPDCKLSRTTIDINVYLILRHF